MALVKADGILVIPKNSEGYEAGEEAPVALVTDMETIENTIVSIGSHDLIMDYIGSILGRKGLSLSSAHVGSMGGIMAIKRGEAHLLRFICWMRTRGIQPLLSGKVFSEKGFP
jgi:putative molybdopterin biosynthesis protein